MTTEKVSFQTVEYMQRLILELDEANTQLRLEAESIAADERAKIVAWLRNEGKMLIDQSELNESYCLAMLGAATDIEAGEHLR